jgi:SOS-response transcriptional repressor LexA
LEGRVSNGDLVTVEPCHAKDLVVGDIVLARVQGRRYSHLVLHLIIAREASLFLLGNNHGRIDGWVDAKSIFGKARASSA